MDYVGIGQRMAKEDEEETLGENPYNAVAKQLKEQDAINKQLSVGANITQDGDADTEAKVYDLSQKTKTPPDYTRVNLKQIEKEEAARQVDIPKQITDYPVISKQLEQPEIARFIHDDVSELNKMERIIKDVGQKWRLGPVQQQLTNTNWDLMHGRGDAKTVEERDNLVERLNNPTDYRPGYWGAVPGMVAQELHEEIVGMGDIYRRSSGATNLITMSTGGGFKAEAANAWQELSTATDETGMPIDNGAARVGAYLVGGATALMELAPEGRILKSIPGAERVMDNLTTGSMKQLLKVPKFRNALAKVARNWGEAATLEAIQEGLTELMTLGAGEFLGRKGESPLEQQSALQKQSEMDVVLDRLFGAMEEGFLVGGGMATPGTVANLAIEANHVRKALKRADMYREMGNTAKDSKTRERLPEKYKEIVNNVTEHYGAIKDVYVDATKLNTFFQEAGITPDMVAENMPGLSERLSNATELGIDVAIPLDEFSAYVAPSDLYDNLVGDLRPHPEALTANEAIEMQAEHETLLNEWKALQDREDIAAEAEDFIAEDIRLQLEAAGRAPDIAGKESQLMSKAINIQAQRQGVDPQEYYKSLNLSVGTEMDQEPGREAISPLESSLNAIREQGFPTQKEMYGESVIDFIRASGGLVDDGGEISAMDLGGRGGIIRKEGKTIADMREMLRDADYGDFDDNELIEVIRDEVGGQARYAMGQENQQAIEAEYQLRTLAGDLESAGLDINTMSNEEIVSELTRMDQSSVDLRTKEGTLEKYGLDPNGKYSTREVAAALEARQRDLAGHIERNDKSTEAIENIAQWMMEEVEFELERPDVSGAGWYSFKFQNALNVLAAEFPELNDDQSARDIMTALIAITSDGQKVGPNFKMAVGIYRNFRDTGEFKADRSHQRIASIENNLQILQGLLAEKGPEELHKLLMTEKTVGELKKDAKEQGIKFSSDYKVDVHMPMAALVFGPKLGAFYANLMGAHGYLTMDRWWSRTFNRYRGSLLTAPTASSLANFRKLMRKSKWSDDETIAGTVEHRKNYEDRDFKTRLVLKVGSKVPTKKAAAEKWHENAKASMAESTYKRLLREHNIERAANTIYKAAFESLEDAPFNASDRSFMLDAVNKAQENLAEKGVDITIADIQAILWYYEKRLYGELGTTPTADISYEEAAQSAIGPGPTGQDVEGDRGSEKLDDSTGMGGVYPEVGSDEYTGVTRLNQSAPTQNIESSEFTGWFKNSKVVDEDGNPLIVYHGTGSDFVIFDKSHANKSTGQMPRNKAFWFASDADVAGGFAQRAGATWTNAEGVENKIGDSNIIPAYLSMQNPLVVDNTLGRKDQLSLDEAIERARQMGNDGVIYKGIADSIGGGPFITIDGKNAGVDMRGSFPDLLSDLEDGNITIEDALVEMDSAIEFSEEELSEFPDDDGYREQVEHYKELRNVLADDPSRFGTELAGVSDVYAVFDSTQIKSAIGNEGGYDPDNPNILKQEYNEGARGHITFPKGREWFKITLTGNANLSTFLHESGHLFLELMHMTASAEGVDQVAIDDLATVRNWLGAAEGEELTTEQHEQFARGWEAYLMEGKAPSNELREIFRSFTTWMVQIYKRLTSLNVELNDDIREVFDRLVATEDEINSAIEDFEIYPLFEMDDMMSMESFQAYMDAYNKAMASARDDLERKAIADLARHKERQYKEQKKKVSLAVEQEWNNRPDANARSFLSRGLFVNGQEIPEGIEGWKLSTQDLKELYPDGSVNKRLVGMHSKKGVSPDLVANALGFANGTEMLQALLSMPTKADWIKFETDRIMREDYGDILTDGTLEIEAIKAIHNTEVSQFLYAELKALGRGKPPPLAIIRQAAREAVMGMRYVDLKPHTFRAGEVKWAKEAQRLVAEKDFDGAAQAKRKQLMNHYMFAESLKARKQIDSVRNYLHKFTMKPARERIGKASRGDTSYINAIDALMDGVDLKKGVSLNTIRKRGALDAFIKDQEAQGNVVNIPEKLRVESKLKSYKMMTLEEFMGLRDAVKTIDHMARFKNKLQDAKDLRDLDESISIVTNGFEENLEWVKESNERNKRRGQERRESAGAVNAMLTKMEFIARWADGGTQGKVHDILFEPLAQAQHSEYDLLEKIGKPIVDALRGMSPSQKARMKQDVKFKGKNYKGSEIVAIALNMGNEGNKDKLLRGEEWTEDEVMKLLEDFMTREDWEFVQFVWDTIDQLWEPLAALEKRVTGLVPPKVQAMPIETPFGTFKGGYYPVKYDPERKSASGKNNEQIFNNPNKAEGFFESDFLKKGVDGGMSETRTSYAGPILLSLEVIPQHIMETAHYVTHYEPVVNLNKILGNQKFKDAVRATLGKPYLKSMDLWLANIANDRKPFDGAGPLNGMLNYLRMGSTVLYLGFRAWTGIAQTMGLLTAADEIGGRWVGHGIKRTMKEPIKTWEFANKHSGEIRHAVKTFDREMRQAFDNTQKAGLNIDAEVARFSLLHIGYIQKSVNVATWIGAYDRFIAEHPGMDADKAHSEAVKEADAVVRTTQSGGGAKDLVTLQFSSEGTKLFTAFYTYFSVLYNRERAMFRKAKKLKDMPKAVAAFSWLIMFPYLAETAIKGADDEDDWLDHLKKMGLYGFTGVPLGRDVAGIVAGESRGFSFATLQPIETAAKAFNRGRQGKFDEIFWRNLVYSAGGLLRLPTKSAWDFVEGLNNVISGQSDDPVRELLIKPERN